jgi:hypothetical protein
MRKKIKINERQFKGILNILAENANINNVLQNLKPNESIKVIDSNNNEIVLNILSFTNNEFKAKDENDSEVTFKKDSFNDTTKEFTVKVINPNTNTFIDKKYVVKDIVLNDVKEPDEEEPEGNEDAIADDEVFKKYYNDIINNPNLKKAFYTAPSLWNYIMAAAKGEKATGKGLYPAYQIINRYYNNASDLKMPGFTDKENLSALFIIPFRIEVPYDYNDGTKDVLILNAGTNKAVVRPYEPGYADNKVLVRRNYGFKIVVKKPTGEKDDQFYCDIYVDKKNVKPDTYKVKDVKLTFIKSKGYEPQTKTSN